MRGNVGELTVPASALIAGGRGRGLFGRSDIRRCGLHGPRVIAVEHDEPGVSAYNDEMLFIDRDEGRVLRRERDQLRPRPILMGRPP